MINKLVKIGIILLVTAILLLTVVAIAANGPKGNSITTGDPWDDNVPDDVISKGVDGDPWDENKVINPLDVHCKGIPGRGLSDRLDGDSVEGDPWQD